MEMMNLNVGTFLTRRALRDPEKVGLIFGDRRLTFAEMNERAERVASAMNDRGIGRGDRVAVLLRNSIPYFDLYYGLARIGAILCGLNWRLAPPEIGYILDNSGARLLVYDEEFADSALSAPHPPELERLIVVGAKSAGADESYDAFLASGTAGSPPPVASGGDEPLLLMYTSGTTGYPKGALLTHRQMFWSSATITYTLDHRSDDVNLLPLPMYHIGGMSFVTVFVHLGATAVLLPTWDPGHVLNLIETERINHFMSVPAMLNSLLHHPDFEDADLSSVRWLLVAAAPVPPVLIRAYAARGIRVQQSYGLTETAGPAAVIGPDMALEKAGSAGLSFFHTELRLADLEGNDVPRGEIGEVWIRGPHVISRYWQNERATAAAFSDSWFRSGDLGYQDEDGYLYIVDRMKDMIISGGENIYPAEVENALYGHPKIAEVAVVGAPDDRWGETVCAVVVPRAEEAISLAELREYCEGRIARYKMPRQLILSREPLPRNPTGKLLKTEIRDQLHQDPAFRDSAAAISEQ